MNCATAKHPGHRRGLALVYVMTMVTIMCAVGSLALDYGRAQCVKTELHRAAEAAAFSALYEVRAGNGIAAAQNAAVSTGALNTADGSAIAVDSTNDVEFGSYDGATDTFTTLTGTARANANAIHVTCRRIAARGTAVNLVLGPVIGVNSVDVTADCVVSVNSPSNFNFVGLNSLNFKDTDVDSFDSSVGAYGGSNVKGNGALASNGNLTFSNSCHIHSEAHPGPSGTITKDAGTQINASTPYNSGSSWPVLSAGTACLTDALYYPLPDATAAATTNNNSQLGAKIDGSNNVNITADTTVAGGTFYFNNVLFSHDKKLIFNSATVIYVTGTFACDGEIDAYLTNTNNLSIYVMGSGAVTFTADKSFYGTIYAPLSDITWSAHDFFGQMIGKTLTADTRAHKFHYDQTLATGSSGGPANKKWIKKPQHWH